MMGGKYKGKHRAGNVEPEADSAEEMTEDEKLEIQAKGRRSPNETKEATERLKDAN